MQQEKWFEKYLNCIAEDDYTRCADEEAIKSLLQEHTERIIKEIEGMRLQRNEEEDDTTCPYCGAFDPECGCEGYNAALYAVINHLKK